MTLYELTAAWQQVADMLGDPDADEETVLDTLEGLDGEIEAKADGYGRIIKNMTAEADAIKAEAARMTARAKTLEARVDLLKARLKEAMEVTGKAKIKTPAFSFSVANNPVSCAVTNWQALPQDFLIPQDPKVDRKKLIDALKAGAEFEGAHLIQGTHLTIR